MWMICGPELVFNSVAYRSLHCRFTSCLIACCLGSRGRRRWPSEHKYVSIHSVKDLPFLIMVWKTVQFLRFCVLAWSVISPLTPFLAVSGFGWRSVISVTIMSNNINTDIHCVSFALKRLHFSLWKLACSSWIAVLHSALCNRDVQPLKPAAKLQPEVSKKDLHGGYKLVLGIAVKAADCFWTCDHILATGDWRSLSSYLYFSSFILPLSNNRKSECWSEGRATDCCNKVCSSHALPPRMCKKWTFLCPSYVIVSNIALVFPQKVHI